MSFFHKIDFSCSSMWFLSVFGRTIILDSREIFSHNENFFVAKKTLFFRKPMCLLNPELSLYRFAAADRVGSGSHMNSTYTDNFL